MLPNLLLRQSLAFGKSHALAAASRSTWKNSFSSLVTRNSLCSSEGFLLKESFHREERKSSLNQHQQIRYYTPLTKEEEEAEKKRVAGLSDFKKEQELRKLNREIMKLTRLKGINTGELYTIRGKYKMLLSEYGMPMMGWYACCWLASGAAVYGLATVGGMDAMAVLSYIDSYTNLNMAARVDPEMGKLGIVLILNEMLEPIRLPFVVLTVRPVFDRVFPPKV